jgi:RimJ/RimL family protein N-acetyltransferase
LAETLERIVTPRLVLEPITREVAEAILDGELSAVRAGQGWPHRDTRDVLAIALSEGVAPGWFVLLDGQVIGECGPQRAANAAGEVELGYGLAAPYRGRGLAKELVRAMSDWLLRQPGIRRLIACPSVENPASRAVLVSAGFEPVGRQAHHLIYARDA